MNTSNISLSFVPLLQSTDGLPTQFSGVAYSGGLIPDYGWFGDVAIDLASLVAPSKPVFALINHDTNQRAGKASFTNTGTRLEIASGSFMSNRHGKEVAAEFAEGAPWEFSVGLNANIERFEKPKTIELNGQTLTVNAVFRDATVREVSFVPAGADPHTQAIAFEKQTYEVPFMELDALKSQLDNTMKLNGELLVKLNTAEQNLATAHEQVKQFGNLKTEFESVTLSLMKQTERADAAEKKLADIQKSIRETAIKALFEVTHREYNDETAKPYFELSDSAFELLASDVKSLTKAKLSADLFRDTTQSGGESDKAIDLSRKLFQQVAGANK